MAGLRASRASRCSVSRKVKCRGIHCKMSFNILGLQCKMPLLVDCGRIGNVRIRHPFGDTPF
jgi:hypothetical protein